MTDLTYSLKSRKIKKLFIVKGGSAYITANKKVLLWFLRQEPGEKVILHKIFQFPRERLIN